MHLFVQLNDILDYMKGLTKTFWAILLDECEPCGAVVLWGVLNFPRVSSLAIIAPSSLDTAVNALPFNSSFWFILNGHRTR